MKMLSVGAGRDYRPGWIHLDNLDYYCEYLTGDETPSERLAKQIQEFQETMAEWDCPEQQWDLASKIASGEYVVAGATHMPFETGEFMLVESCLFMGSHDEDNDSVIKECAHVLNDHGTLFIESDFGVVEKYTEMLKKHFMWVITNDSQWSYICKGPQR